VKIICNCSQLLCQKCGVYRSFWRIKYYESTAERTVDVADCGLMSCSDVLTLTAHHSHTHTHTHTHQ